MNRQDKKYTQYNLAMEMLETPAVIAAFDWQQGADATAAIRKRKRVFFSGEGSSRIFPAKHFIYQALQLGNTICAATDGARQAAEYDLNNFAVFGASNSGKTKELVTLFRSLKRKKHGAAFSVSAFSDTPLGAAADSEYVLSCGKEEAVAATKSVVEQALFYHSLLDRVVGKGTLNKKAKTLGKKFADTLDTKIDAGIIKTLAAADTLNWAGRNTGVAEELTLKTNEITRKRSAYLEGTYAVHGIEEVLTKKDAVIVIEPFKSEEEKFSEVLVKGVGCTVIAISSRETCFPTIRIPGLVGMEPYLRLAAGWNLLVEIGLACKVNMDKTERARKVGNAL